MAQVKIAGILRAGAFSPNHIGNDAAILHMVAEQLRKRSCEVNLYSEEQFLSGAVSERIILNMCRERESYQRLQRLEDEGALVINSGYGVENCVRERLTRIMMSRSIPYPDSLIVDTDEVVLNKLAAANISACWIKRGESHTKHHEDVTYARHPQEAQEMLQEFFLRGIKRAVINRHQPGDLVKFYGVTGTPFFYWFYPFDSAHSKYGKEAINGPSHGLKFDVEQLKADCAKAADILDVQVYGGDCIVAEDGSYKIIDFNDWPSFAPCRAEAAVVIARMVMKHVKSQR